MRSILTFGLLALTAAFAGTLIAQDEAPAPEHRRHAPLLLLHHADADADGVVTTAEWQAMTADLGARFAALDDDGDGRVEVPARPAHRPGRGPAALHREHHRRFGRAMAGLGLMAAADRAGNADGTLSRDEWQTFLRSADSDGDGTLARAEIVEAIDANRGEPAAGAEREAPSIDTMLEHFDRLDANDDGQLGEGERPLARRRPQGRRFGG